MHRGELHSSRIDRFALGPRVGLLWRALGMIGWVRKRKYHRPVIDFRHRLNDLLVEGASDRAHADDGGGLNTLDGSGQIPRWRVLVCVRLLEIHEVLTSRLQEPVDVEQVHLRTRFLKR